MTPKEPPGDGAKTGTAEDDEAAVPFTASRQFSLDAITDGAASDTPDAITLAEEQIYAAEQRAIELALKTAEVDGLKLDLKQRKEYANKIFYLIVVWLIVLLGVLLLQGFGKTDDGFSLSDSVLLAFIGGTTVNVLGIFVIVAKYIFRILPDS